MAKSVERSLRFLILWLGPLLCLTKQNIFILQFFSQMLTLKTSKYLFSRLVEYGITNFEAKKLYFWWFVEATFFKIQWKQFCLRGHLIPSTPPPSIPAPYGPVVDLILTHTFRFYLMFWFQLWTESLEYEDRRLIQKFILRIVTSSYKSCPPLYTLKH